MIDVHLPLESQKRLIEIARQTLECVVRRQSSQVFSDNDPYLEDSSYGAFVTLFKQDELRGCIGICTPSNSLRDTVVEMTEAAATRDPRVKPIRADELERIHIEISVLSQLAKSTEPLSLAVGRHGLHIAHRRQCAVFLPQVAVEYGWDHQTFLSQVCAKASLPPDAWKEDAELYSFTAEVFGE